MGIAVLGPLQVDGQTTGLSPRDRVVLSALVVRDGEPIPTEAADPFGHDADQPGTVFHVWILDVDGQRVVVAVKVVPGHTTNAAEFVHMAQTTELVENVGG